MNQSVCLFANAFIESVADCVIIGFTDGLIINVIVLLGVFAARSGLLVLFAFSINWLLLSPEFPTHCIVDRHWENCLIEDAEDGVLNDE